MAARLTRRYPRNPKAQVNWWSLLTTAQIQRPSNSYSRKCYQMKTTSAPYATSLLNGTVTESIIGGRSTSRSRHPRGLGVSWDRIAFLSGFASGNEGEYKCPMCRDDLVCKATHQPILPLVSWSLDRITQQKCTWIYFPTAFFNMGLFATNLTN